MVFPLSGYQNFCFLQWKLGFFAPKQPNLVRNWYFWSFWARSCRLICCPVGGLVGGCNCNCCIICNLSIVIIPVVTLWSSSSSPWQTLSKKHHHHENHHYHWHSNHNHHNWHYNYNHHHYHSSGLWRSHQQSLTLSPWSTHHHTAQWVSCKVYFSAQLNKLRPILKFRKYFPVEHIFVPACLSVRKIHFFKF